MEDRLGTDLSSVHIHTGAKAAEADLGGRHEQFLELDCPSESELEQRKAALEQVLQDELDRVALTDDQRDKREAGIDRLLRRDGTGLAVRATAAIVLALIVLRVAVEPHSRPRVRRSVGVRYR